MGSTTALRRELKARFFPQAIERGFVIDESRQPLTTTFRRRAGTVVHIFEVQWEKYGTPRFTIHFGTCPADGLRIRDAVSPPEQTMASWCADAGSLQPRRGMSPRKWFRQDATLLQRLLGRPALREPIAVVAELLALFPEIERYWATGEVGSHLTVWQPGRK